MNTPFTATCQGEGDPAPHISWKITRKTEGGDDVAFKADGLITEPVCDETNLCNVSSSLRVEEGEGEAAGVAYVDCGNYQLDCIISQSIKGDDYEYTHDGKLTVRL